MLYFICLCYECSPILPIPFINSEDRAKWMTQHTELTNHKVLCYVEEEREK